MDTVHWFFVKFVIEFIEMNAERLKQLQEQVRIGGKVSFRFYNYWANNSKFDLTTRLLAMNRIYDRRKNVLPKYWSKSFHRWQFSLATCAIFSHVEKRDNVLN